MKGGLGFGAMLFLYKATQGDVSLDTAGMKSRKRISSITAPRVGWGFFPPFFSPSSYLFTHKAGVGCPTGPAGQHVSWLYSLASRGF